MSGKHMITVDGSNVAHAERSAAGQPKVSNLVAMRDALRQRGFEPLIFVDADLVHEIDDPQQLESLLDDAAFRQVPAGTDADYFILETAAAHDALVVSNDRFQDYQESYPWIEERRVPAMIIKGRVELYEPKLDG